MTFNTYCNGACNESDLCQYQDICSAELIETTTCYDNEHLRKSFATGFEFNKKDCIRDCGGTLLMPEISEQRYKGIGKEEILKIQKANMPQYHSALDVDFTKLSDEKVNLDIRSGVEKMIERESHNTEICVLCEMAMRYLDSFSKTEISEQIKDKAEIIAKLLSSGQHVELCENKDGLRIVAMDRKVVK